MAKSSLLNVIAVIDILGIILRREGQNGFLALLAKMSKVLAWGANKGTCIKHYCLLQSEEENVFYVLVHELNMALFLGRAHFDKMSEILDSRTFGIYKVAESLYKKNKT